MNKRIILLLAAVISVLSGSQISQAEQELAKPSAMPYITLLDNFTIYASDQTKPDEAMGSISAFQSVHLAPIESNRLLFITSMNKIPVETWVGKAWINLNEGAYKYGQLKYQEQTLTLLEEKTSIYDSQMKLTEYSLSPQKVQAVASIDACDPYTPCHTLDDWDQWYLIRTSWFGEKWIHTVHYAEKYIGKPVEGMIPIGKESEVFLLPFEKALADEPKVTPQVLKPVAKYIELVRMTPPTVWYQIDTKNGLRWIHGNDSYGLGIEGVQQVDLNLDIPVPFQYYETPFSYDRSVAQMPTTVNAIGQQGDWYFVLMNGSGKWINPSKEISSHLTGDFQNDAKLGVQLSDASLQLTEASIALDTPYVDSDSVAKELTFTPQTVTASRVWTSPNGESWYYIHTWQGAKWVRP